MEPGDVDRLVADVLESLGHVVDGQWSALDEPGEVETSEAPPRTESHEPVLGALETPMTEALAAAPSEKLPPVDESVLARLQQPGPRYARRNTARWLLSTTLAEPDSVRAAALDAVAAACARHGFDEPQLFVDRPEGIQLVAMREDGAQLEVGSARATTVWAISGVFEQTAPR